MYCIRVIVDLIKRNIPYKVILCVYSTEMFALPGGGTGDLSHCRKVAVIDQKMGNDLSR